MTIKMICPAETEENARKAREKLGDLIKECRAEGRSEARWMLAEMATRFFVCFGVGYCVFCGARLLSLTLKQALAAIICSALVGIILSFKLPFLSRSNSIMKHSELLERIRVLNAVIISMKTLSSITFEAPDLIMSETGEEAEILENEKGDIAVKTKSHRYFFPMASRYTAILSTNPFGATLSFQPADFIIREALETAMNKA